MENTPEKIHNSDGIQTGNTAKLTSEEIALIASEYPGMSIVGVHVCMRSIDSRRPGTIICNVNDVIYPNGI